jgi:hypothetical protein
MPKLWQWLAGEGIRYQLPQFFAILVDYRMRVHHLLSFSNGLLESTGLYRYAHSMAGDLNSVIAAQVDVIDDILAMLICPERTHYTMDQLVREYGYPDVDLLEIDAEWISGD